MKKYIDKSALVAEIENWKQHTLKCGYPGQGEYEEGNKQGRLDTLEKILSFLNTLEVKEVNLDESARHYLLHEHISPLNEVLHQADLKVEMQYHKDIEDAYKAGFEFGLKAQNGESYEMPETNI